MLEFEIFDLQLRKVAKKRLKKFFFALSVLHVLIPERKLRMQLDRPVFQLSVNFFADTMRNPRDKWQRWPKK